MADTGVLFQITFSIPESTVETYFDGLARLEKAKRRSKCPLGKCETSDIMQFLSFIKDNFSKQTDSDLPPVFPEGLVDNLGDFFNPNLKDLLNIASSVPKELQPQIWSKVIADDGMDKEKLKTIILSLLDAIEDTQDTPDTQDTQESHDTSDDIINECRAAAQEPPNMEEIFSKVTSMMGNMNTNSDDPNPLAMFSKMFQPDGDGKSMLESLMGQMSGMFGQKMESTQSSETEDAPETESQETEIEDTD